MDKELHKSLEKFKDEPFVQYELAGIKENDVGKFILKEMKNAIVSNDWEVWYTLLGMVYSIRDDVTKIGTLNKLLIMPGHKLHQEITMEIQQMAKPSSVPYIRSVLESNFNYLEYTCSEHNVIAQWFSHALANIGTIEAINLIKEFSESNNQGIANEMSRRLNKISA